VTSTASFLIAAICASLPACDPVSDNAIAALGPEAPGVRRGPLHRPGQPCLLCHDGALGDPQRFTVAGTIFETAGALVAAGNVNVALTDARGIQISLTTNAAGNFYVTPSQYDPSFPLQVSVAGVPMLTLIEGNGTVEPNGGCASCHFDPAGRSTPGHVCLRLDDGGTPP
jgi:hypothetical protein